MRPRHPNQRDLQSLPAELRRTTVPAAARRWVERATGKRVLRWRRLPGASSSAVHLLHLDGGATAVLRRWVWPTPVLEEPEVAQREVDALGVAGRAGLPVPEVLAADPAGLEVGDGVCALLMTRLPGGPTAVPDLHRLAELAASVHAVEAPDLAHEWFAWCVDALVAPPPAATDSALWERALARRAEGPPAYDVRLVHRDFHPGNVLWSRGELSGLVDWTSACRGPWECDVATCRGDLRRLGFDDAAEEFLQAYADVTGAVFHPYWDLNRMLEQDADHWTPEQVARTEPQLRRVLAELGA